MKIIIYNIDLYAKIIIFIYNFNLWTKLYLLLFFFVKVFKIIIAKLLFKIRYIIRKLKKRLFNIKLKSKLLSYYYYLNSSYLL